MSHFAHDALVAHVVNLKTGTDMHGDEERLAVDVKLLVSKAENEKDWPEIIVDLYADQPDALEILEKSAVTVPAISFEGIVHDDYKVNIRASNRVLAGLVHAKLGKFCWQVVKGAEHVTFNVHALADGKSIGAIAEQLRKKIRLETVSHQDELDLGEEQTEDETETAPA